MLIADAIALAQQLVSTRAQHTLYERANEWRRTYKALITGEGGELLLKRFVRREDDEAFQQRVDLTISITPAVCAALMKPFNKVMRNNKVKKNFDFKTDARNKIVQQMRDAFYGRKKSTNKGLDYWLKTRYPILSFIDPNAWVVTEWSAPATAAEVIRPRPFEVSSEAAWNWFVDNEETKWLWVHACIMYKKLAKAKGQLKRDALAQGNYTEESGDKFTLYDEDYTLTYTQIDPDYLKSIGYVKAKNETFWRDEDSKAWYSVMQYEPKLGYVPAFRVGYVVDNGTEEGDGQICVNAFHDAMPYLLKSLKTVSEMDLTMALHTFPQKMQYVQACPGVEKKKCTYGRAADGSVCGACKGAGFKVHTTAQDALYYPLPTDAEKADMLELDKMLVYKSPPIDLLTFQKDYIEMLKVAASAAVFTQTQQTKVSGNTSGSGGAPATATEVSNNMQGVYDALYPFTEKVSDIWIDEINTFGRLAGTPENVDVTITCIFPADFKLKSIDELLVDLKAANEAGAPSFLRDQIYNDIAEVMYQGDEIAERKYKTKHAFFPFNGQTPDEIAMNIGSQYVSTFTKVLYSNFEAIFTDLDLENVDFWFKTYEEQWALVEKMVELYEADIAESTAPLLTVPAVENTDVPGGPSNEEDTPAQ